MGIEYRLKNTGKFVIAFTVITLLFSGCEKLFHEEEISMADITSYEQLVEATQGLYGQLAYSFFGSSTDDYNGSDYYQPNVKSDDLSYSFSGYLRSLYWTRQLEHCEDFFNPSTVTEYEYTDKINYTWRWLYKIIGSVNNILTQFDYNTISDEQILEILGEIHFIRAYCYFRLMRTYGQIPIVNDVDVKYDTPKATFKEIYEFIENDLKIAAGILPANNSEAREPFATPHIGTTKVLLAEVYLSWAGYPCKDDSKYTLAKQEAGEVIENEAFYGFKILNNFADLWLNDNIYNNENVFSVNYIMGKYRVMDDFYQGFLQIDNGYFLGGIYIMLSDTLGFMPLFYPVRRKFFNTYPASYRKDVTFFTTIYIPHGYLYEYPGGEDDIDTLETYINPVEPHLTPSGDITSIDTCYLIHFDKVHSPCDEVPYRKFFYEIGYPERGTGFVSGHTKIYLFRYAQTLLTYAEAAARSGEVNSLAYECVNRIRRRAHNVDLNTPSPFDLQPGLSPEVFADSVVWERAWELTGEFEGRWFDLIRLEMVEDLPNLRYQDYYEGPPNAFNKSEYFFPIPDYDINLNPDLEN
jgi:hypothetical protein